MKVLFVLTSHEQLGNSGRKTGFWLEEFAAPYYVFKDAGAEITLASPIGGQPPIDPTSEQPDYQTEATKRLLADEEAMTKLANTRRVSKTKSEKFAAIFYPGGHGPVWDLAEDKDSIALLESAIAQAIPIGTVCHGPAALRHVRGKDNEFIVKGRNVTGFSNSEEEAFGTTEIVPFLVEDMLKENGATYTKMADWQSYVVEDGLLITGQNPASSKEAAEKLLALLQK